MMVARGLAAVRAPLRSVRLRRVPRARKCALWGFLWAVEVVQRLDLVVEVY